MFALLRKISSFLFGHALVEGIGETIKNTGTRALENAVNKVTKNDLLLGVIFARLGTVTHRPTPQETADGIKKFNRFYASLKGEERDLFEQLFYRDVLDAIQELLKSVTEGQPVPETKFIRLKELTQDELLQIYLAIVGHSGPREIRLEMQRLHQMTLSAKVGKVLTNGGDKAEKLLNAFVRGLGGK